MQWIKAKANMDRQAALYHVHGGSLMDSISVTPFMISLTVDRLMKESTRGITRKK